MLYKEYCQDKSKGVLSVIKTKFSKWHHIIITYVIGYGIIFSIILVPENLFYSFSRLIYCVGIAVITIPNMMGS